MSHNFRHIFQPFASDEGVVTEWLGGNWQLVKVNPPQSFQCTVSQTSITHLTLKRNLNYKLGGYKRQ